MSYKSGGIVYMVAELESKYLNSIAEVIHIPLQLQQISKGHIPLENGNWN